MMYGGVGSAAVAMADCEARARHAITNAASALRRLIMLRTSRTRTPFPRSDEIIGRAATSLKRAVATLRNP
jgi:hypothetical protein